MDYTINETPTVLPPRNGADGLGEVSWLSGGFIPGVMYRVKCGANWQPGMLVGHEAELVRMFPWVYSPLSPLQRTIQEIQAPIFPLDNTTTTGVLLGVAVEYGIEGNYALVAGPGSIVPVVCNSAADVQMRTVGNWCGISADPGVAQSYTAATVVGAGGAGKILGRIVQAAGLVVGLGQTGNNNYAVVQIALR